MLTKNTVGSSTWAHINYRKLQKCCNLHGYSSPAAPEFGFEVVQCADIPALVRKVAIQIAMRTFEKWEWEDVNQIYLHIICYGIVEFSTDL